MQVLQPITLDTIPCKRSAFRGQKLQITHRIHQIGHFRGQKPQNTSCARLHITHKRKSRNADSHTRREDRTQSLKAGMQGAACSKDVVDKEQMLQVGRVRYDVAAMAGA